MEDRRQKPIHEAVNEGSAKAAPPSDAKQPTASGEPAGTGAADALTPEEQMERFERELKETDWGHQPC